MRLVRALFNYAMGQHEDNKGEPLFLHNPVQRITSQRLWFKEKIRQSVVMKYDLKKWYDGVMKLPIQDDNQKHPRERRCVAHLIHIKGEVVEIQHIESRVIARAATSHDEGLGKDLE